MHHIRTFTATRLGFFLSRLLILIGIVVFFTILGIIAGQGLCKLIFRVDMAEINFLNISDLDSNQIAALKLFQTFAGSIGMFLLPALIFPNAIGRGTSYFLKTKNPNRWFNWPIAFSVIIVSVPIVSWMYHLNQGMKFPVEWSSFETQIRHMEDKANEFTKVFTQANSYGMLFLNLIVVAVIPAICEELFFRGILQNFLKMCIYNEIVAIIFAAIIFSGFHGQFYGFLPRFVLGIILGFIYANSGSIWVVIFAHFINNAMATLMIFMVSYYPDVAILKDDYVFPMAVNILSIVMVVGLIWWQKKMYLDYMNSKIQKMSFENLKEHQNP